MIEKPEYLDLAKQQEVKKGSIDVLVIDDEKLYLQNLAEGLRLYEYQFNVITADSATKALAALKTIMVDVVVTDLNMPDMDGYELVRTLQETYPRIQTIVMTGYVRTSVEKRLEGLRFAQFIEKSSDLYEIAGAISNAA
jgi:DNA-binding NarL/FixJ family response regulator